MLLPPVLPHLALPLSQSQDKPLMDKSLLPVPPLFVPPLPLLPPVSVRSLMDRFRLHLLHQDQSHNSAMDKFRLPHSLPVLQPPAVLPLPVLQFPKSLMDSKFCAAMLYYLSTNRFFRIQATSAATRAANTTTAAATARYTGGAANFGAEAVVVGGALAAAFALF